MDMSGYMYRPVQEQIQFVQVTVHSLSVQTGQLSGQHHIRLAAVTVSVSSSGMPLGEVPVSISLCQLIIIKGIPAWGFLHGAIMQGPVFGWDVGSQIAR